VSAQGQVPAAASGGTPQPAAADEGRRRFDPGTFAARFYLIFVWAVVIAVFGILRPHTFLSQGNLTSILSSQAVLVFLTLALLSPFLAGDFDLSVASTMGLSATLIAVLNGQHEWSLGIVLLIALFAGLLVGAVNGLLVVKVGVDSIVATLGMSTFLVGIALWISNLETAGGISQTLLNAMTDSLFGLPYAFYYCIILAAILWWVFEFTPFGRQLVFVGRNPTVARLSGINVSAVRFAGFMISGLIGSLAGIVCAGQLGAFQSSTAPTYLLPAFAAAYLGATVIKPGRFNPWGSLVAIYFLITGISGLQLIGLTGWVNEVFYGGALMVAVTISTIVARHVRT
jgi:ribose transport system permease protein